ncbi:Uncharacterised protein [Chlamydia trachomatis]|nr:Uncharacterised protein [Chlamydia trachomatis]
MNDFSNDGEYGIAGTSGPASLMIGASRSKRQFSAMIADTSLMMLPSLLSSVINRTFPVLDAASIMAS